MTTEQDDYKPIETGLTYDQEKEPGQMGHHETPETPNTCLCCGVVYYYLGPHCICAQNGNYWLQDELRRVSCFFHVQTKMTDGEFGALEGDFAVPASAARQKETGQKLWKPAHKPYTEGAVAPIVHK
jgi:hypothetical protein